MTLSQKLNMVLGATPEQLIRFCYENGIENARAYTEDMLREMATQIILKSNRKGE